VRVDLNELRSIIRTVSKSHQPESSAELDAVYYDIDNALEEAGFALDRFKKTGELERMILCTCHPESAASDHTDVLERLESAWDDAALGEETHAVGADAASVVLEFIDLREDRFYTGRIEARLGSEQD
jgi:hypothetical protein